MNWSPAHNRKGLLTFLFGLFSFSEVTVLGFYYWFLDFLPFPFPFFLLWGVCVVSTAFTSIETIGVEGVVVELLYFLAGFTVDGGWIERTTP